MGGSMGVTQGMLGRVRARARPQHADLGDGDRRRRHRRGHAGHAARSSRSCTRTSRRSRWSRSSTRPPSTGTCPGGSSKVPLTVRTQGGAGWSPGAQHAQQLEAWFVHVPGLKVVFASTPTDVRGLLWSSIYDDNTVLFFEHRTLYPIKEDVPDELEPIPARRGACPPRGRGRDRDRDRTARARGAGGSRRGRAGGRLRRGRRPAHAAAARRGDARRFGEEDEPVRRRARGGRPRRLRCGGRCGRSSTRPSTGSTRRSSASVRSSLRFRSRR